MRMLSKNGIVPRARLFRGEYEWLVRLRLGSLRFVMPTDEALSLARQIVAAVDQANATDSDRQPKNAG